jgi:hypothetical protein
MLSLVCALPGEPAYGWDWWLFGISRGQDVGLPNLLGVRREEPEQVRDSDTSSTQPHKDPDWLRYWGKRAKLCVFYHNFTNQANPTAPLFIGVPPPGLSDPGLPAVLRYTTKADPIDTIARAWYNYTVF